MKPGDVTPSLAARLARWLGAMREQEGVKNTLATVQIREGGEKIDTKSPPLAEVSIADAASTPDIAAQLAAQLVTLAAGDVHAGAVSFRLYLTDPAGTPLRHGWAIKVTRADCDRANALAEVLGGDAPQLTAEDRARAELDAATKHLLVAQATHYQGLTAALTRANDDVREQSKLAITMVGAVTKALADVSTMAQAAIDQANASRREAEALARELRGELADARKETKRAGELAEKFAAMAEDSTHKAEERRWMREKIDLIAAKVLPDVMKGARRPEGDA